jgi:hypothetical protein
MQSQSISPYDPDVLFMHYQAKSGPGGALDDRFSCAFHVRERTGLPLTQEHARGSDKRFDLYR